MFAAGVNAFRLNTSHGAWDDHLTRIANVRAAAAELDIQAGILLDLQGPKIRLGTFQGGQCELETGGVFSITTEKVLGTAALASTSYSQFAKDVKPGDRGLHLQRSQRAVDLPVPASGSDLRVYAERMCRAAVEHLLWSGAHPGAGRQIDGSDAAANGTDAGRVRPPEAARQRRVRAGQPIGCTGSTNLIKLHRIGESK